MKHSKFFVLGIVVMLSFVFVGCDTDPGDAGAGTAFWMPEYAIGDTGPGGGKIFYIDQEGFTNTYDGSTCHYLEVAPSAGEPCTWITQGYDSVTANNIMADIRDETGWDDENVIGTGRKNTQIILSHDPTAPAAYACVTLNTGDKNDWFLPSEYELSKLLLCRTAIDITDEPTYWSSSVYTFYEAEYMDFAGSVGNYKVGDVDDLHQVRAVRAF
ncbi:MAG: DUF1566 domain-containing protein [Gracilibacteraceae bacterium]|jgi:hypothetical protein|nr:DUF1566 domain-containing protein [Gracilibacteraceae bacterium]